MAEHPFVQAKFGDDPLEAEMRHDISDTAGDRGHGRGSDLVTQIRGLADYFTARANRQHQLVPVSAAQAPRR
jgi:hypothetical protein